MTKYTELMLQYSDNELNIKQSLLVEKELSVNNVLKKEYALNLDIDKYMKGEAIVNQIYSDVGLSQIEPLAKNDIAEYLLDKSGKNSGLSFYIKGALTENDRLIAQIDEAEREMDHYHIENETLWWVDSWYKQKEHLLKNDTATQEIFNFVELGMKADYQPEQITFTNHSVRKLLYRVASVAAIFVISFGLWMLFLTKPSTEELFAEYYQPYQVIDGQTRSNQENVNKLFKDAVKSYRNNDFEASSLAFKELLEIDNTSPKMRLLFSITQIELQNYKLAITGLNHIINANGDFVVEAKWYLAMCYLKTDNIKDAKLLLKELSVLPGYYKNKAIELLEEL